MNTAGFLPDPGVYNPINQTPINLFPPDVLLKPKLASKYYKRKLKNKSHTNGVGLTPYQIKGSNQYLQGQASFFADASK